MQKSVNYVIQPRTARPSQIQRRLGGDFYDFDLDQVELAAFRETLQTTLGANPFSAFISGFLVPYSGSLIWLGEGPGVGREMRRAFSALFGRFFARAYLSDCHNLVWFAPLNGPDHVVRERLRVRSRGSRQDLPDWICASRAHLALAEAKGARSGSRLTSYSHPAPIKQAIKQLQNCRVSTFRRGTGNWVDRKVKGWAVLNRWSFQLSDKEPFLFVVDPETEGDPLTSDELPPLIRAVAREHVGGLFRGLRLFDVANTIPFEAGPYRESASLMSSLSAPHVVVSIAALHGVQAIGRLFRSNPGDPIARLFGEEIFVGVQSDIFEDLRVDSETLPMVAEPQYLPSEGVVRGPDGFIVARQSAVTPLDEG
jgi:hypothetical protein